MAQVSRSAKVYDVCIVGSGAAGGTAAKVLTEGGLNVVMLEAGPPLNPEKDFKMFAWPYQLPHRGVGVGGKLRGELNSEFMALGKSKVNLILRLLDRAFAGSARALSVAAPTTGDESLSASRL